LKVLLLEFGGIICYGSGIMTDLKLRHALRASGLFSWLDLHFAAFIARLAGAGGALEIPLAAALLSRRQRAGHLCLELNHPAGSAAAAALADVGIALPEASGWAAALKKSDVVGRPGEFAPLILDARLRLYLHRYWEYQDTIAGALRQRSASIFPDLDARRLAEGMARLFPPPPSPEGTDWQKVAAFAAISRRFAAISGGPGTGKTTTVAKILALLFEQCGAAPFRIALAAPTGKAAARLREAIIRGKSQIDSPSRDAIPEDVTTIHRLLGSLPNSPDFRFNAGNPLPVDLVVVDEASMVDCALMARLILALPVEARLILLGDRDQLASVEAGAVFGDICDTGRLHQFSPAFCRALDDIAGEPLACPRTPAAAEAAPGLSDGIVVLKKSYRFGEGSGIGQASRRINAGDGEKALGILASDEHPDVRWRTLPRAEGLASALRESIETGFGPYLTRLDDPAAAFRAFDRFRILAAVRRGPFGVERLNDVVEEILRSAGLIPPRTAWYSGRPVMVTRNDYHLRLFNGDVGISLPVPSGQVRVWFSDGPSGFRSFSPLRLPAHETVYAMTVHKSQGAEFDHVMMILPDRDSPVLTRELLYTGITRAVRKAEVWGARPIWTQAAARSVQRNSGLRDALWHPAVSRSR
jgi:exodeoxyribonuclease V alpha subunit